MKNITLFISLLFVSLTATAEIQHLRLGPGKVIAYEHLVANEGAPTLVLLPGVNRALTADDPAVEILLNSGWNMVLPSLPAHPESIRGLKRDEDPYYRGTTSVRVNDFAKDIDQLLTHLKVKKVIPVSLSYSSAVAAYMDPVKYPHVIETVPMGNQEESNPQAAAIRELWENWFRLNPYMAPFWIRQFRDQGYWAVWGMDVNDRLSQDPEHFGASPRVWDIKSGYVTIARASEDFDFTHWDFAAEDRTRDFVLAGSEDPVRMKNQVIALKNYLKTGRPTRVIVVEGVSHILPSVAPELYANILAHLASSPQGSQTRFMIIGGEGHNRNQWLGREALEAWMKTVL